MGHVYSVEVLICATAYIRADSEAEAVEIAQERFTDDDASTSRRSMFGEIEVSESQFDDEDLPDVSLSPAMTFCGSAQLLDSARALGLHDFNPDAFDCVHDDSLDEAA
jgi:hypothetical protein